MSRFCGEDNADPVLRAAEEWRDRALRQGGSVFSDSALWSLANIEDLHRYYVLAENDGTGTFLEKFKVQLSESSPEIKQLAAEMIWLLVLCSKSIAAATKRSQIEEGWSWSGQQLTDSRWLANPVLNGIGGTGQGFNFNRWRELVFLIEFLLRFRSLSASDQGHISQDSWRFSEWLAEVPGAEARQLRHMLLYLLYPDDFERVFSGSEKVAIAGASRETPSRELERLSLSQLDRELRAIRAELESKYQTSKLDFYAAIAFAMERRVVQSVNARCPAGARHSGPGGETVVVYLLTPGRLPMI